MGLIELTLLAALASSGCIQPSSDCGSCDSWLNVVVTFEVQPPEVVTVVLNGTDHTLTYGTTDNPSGWEIDVALREETPESLIAEVFNGQALLFSGTFTPEYSAGFDECLQETDERCQQASSGTGGRNQTRLSCAQARKHVLR